MLPARRGGNSANKIVPNLPGALQVHRCLWDKTPPLDFPRIKPHCWVFPFHLLRPSEVPCCGCPCPNPRGLQDAAQPSEGRELGSSVFREHQEGDGAVPRLFSLWIKTRSCKKGRFCSATAEGKARGVTWWLSSAESLSEPRRGEKDKQLLCCCPAGCCLSAQFGAKPFPSVGQKGWMWVQRVLVQVWG